MKQSIPDFTKGVLPLGVFTSTLPEILQRFAYRTRRRAYLGNLLAELYDLAIQAGGTIVIIGGSFVTDTEEPNDIDCAVLLPNLSADAEPQRWDRSENVRLDLKICKTLGELLNWQALLTMQRGTERAKGIINLTLPELKAESKEYLLTKEPLIAEPRGTFSSTPKKEKEDVLVRLLFKKMEVDKKSSEGFLKTIMKAGIKIADSKYPGVPDELGIDYEKLLSGKKKIIRDTDLSDVDLKKDELLILENIRDNLTMLDYESLNAIYKKTLKLSDVSNVVEDWMSNYKISLNKGKR